MQSTEAATAPIPVPNRWRHVGCADRLRAPHLGGERVEFRVERVAPGNRSEAEDLAQPGEIETRIARALGAGWIVLGTDRSGTLDRKRAPARAQALNDRAGKAVPARLARSREMEETAGF